MLNSSQEGKEKNGKKFLFLLFAEKDRRECGELN